MQRSVKQMAIEIWSKFLRLSPETKWVISLVLIAIIALIGWRISLYRNKSADEVIKIGAILPQTGPGAVFARYIQEGSDLAAEEINVTHTRKIRIVYEDSKNLPREGVTVYNKLISTERPPVVMVA